ncbi:hypothetical protein TSUD_57000 [Trifolium subterraneum]|uniref:Uncharacterized protein n=1 Tax=Trifolium subterraneum TaxID=3900 RepID=A0A2Z6NMR1_TRISU|nr:hypothetical protein TSUD_57000 [Trifolium subterraneum]
MLDSLYTGTSCTGQKIAHNVMTMASSTTTEATVDEFATSSSEQLSWEKVEDICSEYTSNSWYSCIMGYNWC